MLKFLIFSVAVISFSLINAEIEKRQVGVLARTGVLPQGKRGVESLARNGELPGKRTVSLSQDERQRIYRIANWMTEMDATQRLHDALEHEMMKRNMEAMARSGYLVKPATEAPEPRSDLLDPEDFLGKVDAELLANEEGLNLNVAGDKRGGLASLARHGYVGKRDDEDDKTDDDQENFLNSKRNIASYKSFVSRYGKRNIGSFRNFNSGKRHVGAARNFANKRNYLVQDDGDTESDEDDYDEEEEASEKRNIGSARRFTGKRNLGAARNFLYNQVKRNLGATRQFFASENKKNLGAARNFNYGKRNIASFARDGGFGNLRQLRREEDYPWDEDEDFDFDDYHESEKRHLASFLKNQSGKRYLGSLRAGKRNLAAFKNLGKRLFDDEDVDDILGKELDGASMIAKRDTKSTSEGVLRRKRSAEFAFPELGPDGSYFGDYEDEPIANTFDKRFLGFYAGTSNDLGISKRHIGALARLGLLPAFRSTRYSRSGRAINTIVPFREDSPIRACRTAEDSTTSWSSASPAAEAQLALRRSTTMSYAPTPSKTRHPMSYHRMSYV